MPREWYTTCKDCGKEFGYSDDSYQLSMRRGQSRPERCPECRKLHAREISTLGLSHFELTPLLPVPLSGLRAGRLGGLVRPPRVHEARDKKSSFDFNKFGIKDTHICEYFNLMTDPQKRVTVVVAPTGAGKSTFLPYRLMVPSEPFPPDLFTRNGQIIITQPRIQATRNIPLFVARDLHGSNLGAGFDVGFKHSGSPSTDWRNKMVYMTDGTLINMIVRNELNRLSVIMIDEAHERSLNIDLILGLLRLQLSRYPNLKLIIASATINAGMFLEYFGGPQNFNPDDYAKDTDEGFLAYDNAQIAEALKNYPVGFYGFPGKRQYPVETRFREENPIPEEQWSGRMPDEMAKKILQILHDMQAGEEQAKGDILGFLHGEAPIERTVDLIRAGIDDDNTLAGQVDVLPLYTKLQQKQQDAALLPKKKKGRLRVVISTNVAETSLTVDGIVHVVDSGLINESQWDSRTQTSFVVPKIHSQAGCKQRWGRGGRIQPGVAHCLYTQEQFDRFPKHTDPEILRAPLDQIVLTAKAAGVDNIQTFAWIQRPAQEELDRAPRFLQQIGAIDPQGDLTDHGLELRSFGEEVDIANLMILADRFGCAVEMATILPMRNLGGYTRLLLWDKGWDAHTKRSIHRIHQGLLGPCLDDVEFSLKMWQAWEGLSPKSANRTEREKWCGQFFVNHHVFHDQVESEREDLLASLSGHKKEQKYRPINFNLLTRLRILMTYGLPNQIYLLEENQNSQSELSQAPVYHPYIVNPGGDTAQEELHAGAVVEVSPESICAGRALQAFVCGQRLRTRRRMSPLSEPLTIITASFLTLIKPEWLRYINQPIMTLARLIASETRVSSGDLIATTTQARLFIDQIYPVGATFRCRQGTDVNRVQIGTLIAPAPLIQPRRSNEDIDAPVDLEVLEAEKAIQGSGISEEDKKFIVDVEEDAPGPAEWVDLVEEVDEEAISSDAQASSVQWSPANFSGRIVHAPVNTTTETEFHAFVTGYDFTGSAPSVLLEIPDQPTPFEKFAALYKRGDPISAVVSSVEQYVNDRLTYLVVREEKTGLEIILDPYDASLGGRNFAVEILQPGEKIEAIVEDIDAKARRVKVSRLKQAEAEIIKFSKRGDEQIIEAVIVEVRDNGLHVWLNPDPSHASIPISSFVYIDRLPQRPDEMWLGRTCKVKVRPQQFRREIRRGVGSLSDEDLKKLQKFPWDGKLSFDVESGRIIASRRLTYEQRNRLLTLIANNEFQKAVNILYRRTNEIEARVLDMTGMENLAQYQGQRAAEKWKVTKVLDDSILVASPDGFETVVPKREVVYDQNIDLHAVLNEGAAVDVKVKQVDLEDGRADLSLLKPEEDPLNKFQSGQRVQGRVVNIVSSGGFLGANIELEPGVQGRIHISEIAWWRIERVEDALHPDQIVQLRIIDIDRHERRLYFTMRMSETDPLRQYKVNQLLQGKVVGFTKNGSGVFVELSPGAEGYVYKDEISFNTIQDARLTLKDGQIVTVRITELDLKERKMRLTMRGLYEIILRSPLSHIHLIKGPRGSTIIQLTEETQTRIDIDDDGTCTIQGLTEKNVTLAKQRIERILATRIVTFNIEEIQARRLIGKGGEIIKNIQNNTSAQIQVESNTNQVTITAADNFILQRALTEIQNRITFMELVILVSPDMIGRRVIGTGGKIKDEIQQSAQVTIKASSDGSGVIYVEGKTAASVLLAEQIIRNKTGWATQKSIREYRMPAYQEIRTEVKPSFRITRPPSHAESIPTREREQPTPQYRQQPIQTPSPQFRVTRSPQTYQMQIQYPLSKLPNLFRKQGGFFTSLFGLGKTALDIIIEETHTQIRVNSTTGVLTVTGTSQEAVNSGVQRLRNLLT